MQLREYKKSDKDSITSAVEKLHDYIVVLDPIQRLRKMPGYVEQEVEDLLQTTQKNSGKIYIAEDEGKFIGFIAGFVTKQSEENLLSVIPTKLGIISDIYIDEAQRGKGIGEALIKKMEAYLKEAGCDTIWINIVAFNTKAHQFYKKNGYIDREVGLMKRLVR